MQEDDDATAGTDGGLPGSRPEDGEDMLQALFRLLQLSSGQVEAALERAGLHGSRLEDELIAGGAVEEEALYRAMADLSDFTFLDALSTEEVSDADALDVQLKRPSVVRLKRAGQAPRMALVPDLGDFSRFCHRFRDSITHRRSHVITTPSALRRAVWEAGATRRAEQAVSALFHREPFDSARMTLISWQAFSLGGLVLTVAQWAIYWPFLVLGGLHLFLSLVYSMTIFLRWKSLFYIGREEEPTALPESEGRLPVYSVLVALHREGAVIEQLVSALTALDWPASRLDIKLVCEADDRETLDALETRRLPPHFEMVRVPYCLPRTKPKALTYALAGVRGAFVTVFDAEDRPDPGQLREAYHRFRQEDAGLACLQAPLAIDNGSEGWLATLFACEYFAQFHGFLRMTERHGWPMPLGGTSNHFRVKALLDVGGWDPHNVTEDADLGLRLARKGYRVGLLRRPTRENAPTRQKIWIGQRSRWLKGWLQTFLVSLRQPVLLLREVGWTGVGVLIINSAGTVLSALLYPFFFLTLGLIAICAWRGTLPDPHSLTGLLLMLDGLNMVAGYAYYLTAVLWWHRLMQRPLPLLLPLRIPYLWMMLTLAAWKALGQLIRNPHRWEKTPHEPVGGTIDTPAAGRADALETDRTLASR